MLREYLPYVIIGVVAMVAIAATVVLARISWHRQVRRYIITLMGRREAIVAALRAFDSVVAALLTGSPRDVLVFAGPGSEDRKVVAEVASRMRIEADELAGLALPKKLWTLADFLGVAAGSLATSASGVGESEGEAVLDALGTLDLTSAREALASAGNEIGRLAEIYDLTEPSVYGGGLYI